MSLSDDLFIAIPLAIVAIIQILVLVVAIPREAHSCGGIWSKFGRQADVRQSTEGGDREEPMLAQRVAEMRVSYLQKLLKVVLHSIGFLNLAYSLQLLFSPLLEKPAIKDGVWGMISAIGYLTALGCRCYPKAVNERTLWVLHSWCMGLIMAYGLYLARVDSTLFVYSNTHCQFGRILLSFSYPEALPNFIWNAAWAALSIAATLQGDAARLGIPGASVIGHEIGILLCFAFMLHQSEQLQVSMVRNEFEAKGHLRAKETMEKVLASMCDAVVELDRQLDIRQPCRKLVDLLIKPVSNLALKGERFPSLFFDDRDRERFEAFVSPRSVPMEQDDRHDGDGPGSSLYVNLRDASGTAVSVQLFHSCHHDRLDDICHIVGVREVQETASGDTYGQQEVVGLAPSPRESVLEETESVVSSASGENDGTTTLAPVIPEHKSLDPVSALVDPIKMQIIACTIGFKSYTGPLLNRCGVSDIVVNMADFLEWVQPECEGRIVHKEPQKLELKLTPALVRKRPHFEFRADAYIVAARMDARASDMGLQTVAEREEEDEEEEEYDILCVLALRNVEPHWLRGSKRRRSTRRKVGLDAPSPRQSGICL